MLRVGRVIAVCSIAIGVLGQASAPAPTNSSTKTLTFDVASIKPDKSMNRGASFETLPDGFRWTNWPLAGLLREAFGVHMDNQIVGLPGWVNSDPYDVEAKVDADTAEAWKKLTVKERWKQEGPMMQSLLIDRCQLKFHFEKRELPVYEMVVAKGGLKMKDAAADEDPSESISSGKLTAHAQSTDSIVTALSWDVGRLILDKTGLEGKKFDFEMKWTPDNDRAAAAATDADGGPSIFRAFEEQLGLKLVPDKAPLDVLVIDHIERPSPN
jgi:uncharacterized protein (TIGR03435 family)